MSKQLETIINKAMKTGFANKNSRMSFGQGYYGDLESQWQACYNKETDTFELDHWGTNIITMEGVSGEAPKVAHIYGQSKSDRDAIMFVFSYFDCKDFSVSYKPSRDEFHCFVTFIGKKEPQEFII